MGYELNADDSADEAVEALGNPETFDALAWVRGAHTPGDTITVYTDSEAVLALSRLLAEEEVGADGTPVKADVLSLADETKDNSDEIDELVTRLDASALQIALKGLAPELVDAMTKHHQAVRAGKTEDKFFEEFNNELISKTITKVTNPAGAVDTSDWTPERVSAFVVSLYSTESDKLFSAVVDLTYVGTAFERVAKADFLRRR